jgi:hypothetical protein
VAGGPDRVDQGEQRVGVAVVTHCLDVLDVAGGLPLVPDLQARAAEEVRLAGLLGERQRVGVHVGEREDLSADPVLHDARDQPALVEFQLRCIHRL